MCKNNDSYMSITCNKPENTNAVVDYNDHLDQGQRSI